MEVPRETGHIIHGALPIVEVGILFELVDPVLGEPEQLLVNWVAGLLGFMLLLTLLDCLELGGLNVGEIALYVGALQLVEIVTLGDAALVQNAVTYIPVFILRILEILKGILFNFAHVLCIRNLRISINIQRLLSSFLAFR